MNSTFIARIERILSLYRKTYSRKFPVVCFDERPCFLIGEHVSGLELRVGQPSREHYAYEKKGSCNLLMTIEPLTGKRIADVFDQRRKREFALHLKKVIKEFPQAEKIIVILDNLNTHNASSFYETLFADEAFDLSEKFEFVYTPKGILAKYNRNRTLSPLQALLKQRNPKQRTVRTRSDVNYQRLRKETNQNRLAVFKRKS